VHQLEPPLSPTPHHMVLVCRTPAPRPPRQASSGPVPSAPPVHSRPATPVAASSSNAFIGMESMEDEELELARALSLSLTVGKAQQSTKVGHANVSVCVRARTCLSCRMH